MEGKSAKWTIYEDLGDNEERRAEKGDLKSLVLHKNKLLELIQWSIALTRPVKLQFADFKTKLLKMSYTSLAPALIRQRTSIEKDMIY